MHDEAIDRRKKDLRAHFRELRDGLEPADRLRADSAIAQRVLSLPEYEDAVSVLTYLSFGTEVDTHEIVKNALAAGKVVALPYCVPGSRDMRWYRVTSLDGLVRSKFGVLEPVPRESERLEPDETPSISLVPGLTFDERGYRLGYGGGFYDTFLSKFSGVSVGLCREAQLSLGGIGTIDRYDLPVRIVITDERVLRP